MEQPPGSGGINRCRPAASHENQRWRHLPRPRLRQAFRPAERSGPSRDRGFRTMMKEAEPSSGAAAWDLRPPFQVSDGRSAARPPPRPAHGPTGCAPAPVPRRRCRRCRSARNAPRLPPGGARLRPCSVRPTGTASCASTVQRSGVTSAKPPATYSVSVTRSFSYSAMAPPRSMTIIGWWPSSTPMSPSLPGITTMSTGRDSSSFSGLTISRFTGMVFGSLGPLDLGRFSKSWMAGLRRP